MVQTGATCGVCVVRTAKMFAIKCLVFEVVWILCATGFVRQGSCEQAFIEQPAETSAIIGDAEAILKCAVSDIAGDLIWEKDGVIIAHANPREVNITKETQSPETTHVTGNHTAGEYHLSLKNVTLQDDGSYRCYVTEIANHTMITSPVVKLTVGKAPGPISIIGSPSKTVVAGKPTNLTCEATSANPPATMSWFRDGVSSSGALYVTKPTPNDASKKLSDSTSALLLTPTKDDNGRTYECQATNMALESETPRKANISLDVQYAPVVTVENNQSELREEMMALFNCTVDANPESVTYAWSRNGEPIPGESGMLELALSRDDHNAMIGCAATNTIGITEGSFTLSVLYGPKIIESPEGVSVDLGAPGSMQCSAVGNPSPTIKWTRLGSQATLSNMPTLQFDSVTESAIGVYVCTATVVGFDPVVSYGRLAINGLPEITSAPVQKAKLKGKAKLTCFTGTKPDPHTIIWSWEGGQLQAGTKGRYSVIREETRGGILSTLTITKVKSDDFMDYNCTMVNSVGSKTFIISLQQGPMDLIIYIIIGVVATALFIFLVTIILMVYCKRRYQRRQQGKGKVEIEIVRRSDSEDSIDKPKRSGSSTSSSTNSKPRYADPHDYVPARRGSRHTHDTWEDPIYHPGSYNPDWRDSFRDQYPRRSYAHSSNDYIEPDDLPHGNLPEWKDNFDDDKPRSVVDDSKSYGSISLSRRSSKYQQPPSYDEYKDRRSSKYQRPQSNDEFKDRYPEDDEYMKEWPEMTRRYSNHSYSRDSRYSRDDHIYSNDPYFDQDDRSYNDRDRYGKRSDYDDRGYDRLSNKGSDVSSNDSKLKLATNV
ncbi:kin of IRRE-like protein 3 [Amphiura filiformis]|uniref:kin of IRRE-like protein 3 n=1 Tax=Amphiura filiformis TaxID=82378 RepID=UPI003B221A9B